MSDDQRHNPIRAYLIDSDDRCPVCRYALRGCTSERCPECGYALRLQLVRPGAASFLWMVGAMCSLLSVLLALFFTWKSVASIALRDNTEQTAAMIARGFVAAPSDPDWRTLIGTVILATLVVGWSAGWLAVRTHFARWPLVLRILTVVMAMVSPLVLISAMHVAVGFTG